MMCCAVVDGEWVRKEECDFYALASFVKKWLRFGGPELSGGVFGGEKDIRWSREGENCDRGYYVVASPHDGGLPRGVKLRNEPNWLRSGPFATPYGPRNGTTPSRRDPWRLGLIQAGVEIFRSESQKRSQYQAERRGDGGRIQK